MTGPLAALDRLLAPIIIAANPARQPSGLGMGSGARRDPEAGG